MYSYALNCLVAFVGLTVDRRADFDFTRQRLLLQTRMMTTRVNDHHTHSRKRSHEHANLPSQGRPSRGGRNPHKQRRYSQHSPTSPSTQNLNKHANTSAAPRKSPSPSSLQPSPFPEIEPGTIGFQRPALPPLPLPVLFPPWLTQPNVKRITPSLCQRPLDTCSNPNAISA